MRVRRYSELRRLPTREERFEYLSLRGEVGAATFGFDRWVNQAFYRTPLWRQARELVILRDMGCDLGIEGHEIHSGLLVHHMNPMDVDDILEATEWITDPEFLITTRRSTHNAIHYGDASLLSRAPVVRRAGDTKLW